MPAPIRLFAYGTLKDPARLAAVVGPTTRCRVVGAGRVRGVLYDVGDYPALRPSRGSTDTVAGLLLELHGDTALERVDAYEGVDSGLYLRRRCVVRLDDGRRATAWTYVYNRSTAALRRIAAWPSQHG
jgi:gamma-glutamylcyclotransferase (GGCT)/AIG2-like uncharacterized protein YtfP